MHRWTGVLDLAWLALPEKYLGPPARGTVPHPCGGPRDPLAEAPPARPGCAPLATAPRSREGGRPSAKSIRSLSSDPHFKPSSKGGATRLGISGRPTPLFGLAPGRSSSEALGPRGRAPPTSAPSFVPPTSKASAKSAPPSESALPPAKAAAPMLSEAQSIVPRCKPTASPEWRNGDVARILQSVATLIDPPWNCSRESVPIRLMAHPAPSGPVRDGVPSAPNFSEI